jgi:hypothetical protein
MLACCRTEALPLALQRQDQSQPRSPTSHLQTVVFRQLAARKMHKDTDNFVTVAMNR